MRFNASQIAFDRKAATVVNDSGAGMWLAEPPPFSFKVLRITADPLREPLTQASFLDPSDSGAALRAEVF